MSRPSGGGEPRDESRRRDTLPSAMLATILSAFALVALTVVIHASGLAFALSGLLRTASVPRTRFWPITWLVIRIAWRLIVIHLCEITVWALFYWWQGCLPDAESSLYFAGVTYTTLGYGDLVLPQEWRILGPIEGLTGILMCGLSTGFFFAVVSKVYAPRD